MFIHDDFMLQSEAARRLYHEYAAGMPIFDYHCHLSPEAIASDQRFENLTQIWLAGDHYKWRAMRANGIEERLITGGASDRAKFDAWAQTVPKTIGNPLYHWTHLELNRPFGINDVLLSEATADVVWDRTTALLSQPEFSARGIIRQMNVRVICTTDDPVDDLGAHRRLRGDESFDVKVLPTFRPDKAIHIEQGDVFRAWVGQLSAVVGRGLKTLDDLMAALSSRMDYFHAVGCRLSDHALSVPVFRQAPVADIERAYADVLAGRAIGAEAVEAYQTYVLTLLAQMYRERGWVMQLHMGALRNNHQRMFGELGPDTGFDSIGDGLVAAPLNAMLNSMDQQGGLPKTILYTLNAAWNDVLATAIGNFQDGEIPGKMQFGSGWWFYDQADGMRNQMRSLATMGLLSRFVGMLTDSRSFLSYPRHEYFRRVLCDLLGDWMTRGEAPQDYDLVGKMVQDICWDNAVNYFELG